jgi:uncharacterized membrane-anchored protein YjiN (DUF445 family)
MIRIERACLDLLKELRTCENIDKKLEEFKELLFSCSLEAVYGSGVWDKIEEIRKGHLTK